MLTKVTSPYEFLVRWNPDGSLSGAHVVHRTQVLDDDKVLTETLQPAMPVSEGKNDASDFPLTDILETIQIAMLAANTRLTEELEASKEEVETMRKAILAKGSNEQALQNKLDAIKALLEG